MLKIRPVLAFFASVSLYAAATTIAVSAQNIDPAVLKQLQERAGQGGIEQRQVSPVDASRRIEAPTNQTPEELRPVVSESTSAIEEDFRQRLGNDDLRQFGYAAFAHTAIGNLPTVGRLGNDYVIGLGDEIVAVFQGSEEAIITTRVDSEGRLILGKLPPIEAAGRTFGDLRREIEERTKQTLLGTEVYISIGAVKSITVQVVGEVGRPGAHRLTSLSDVLNALTYAGGVRKTGSLRNIAVLRGNERISVDLYDLLSGEKNVDFELRDGDRIVVPPIGPTIAINGAVLRPAIFELPASGKLSTVSEYIKLAGGTVRPGGNIFIRNRIADDGYEVFADLKDLKENLKPGDAINVFFDADNRRERVLISGHVFAPGPRALGDLATLETLVAQNGTLKNEPYLPFAVLQRIDPLTQTSKLHAVNLLSPSSRNAFLLQNDDHLFVFGRKDLRFLTSSVVRDIVLGQPNSVRGCRVLDKLVDLVTRVQNDRYAGAIRGVFLTEKAGRAAVADVGNIETEASILGETGSSIETVDVSQDERSDCPEIFEGHPDLLPFALEHLVTVSGAVRSPGALPVADKISIATLVALSGGFSLDASEAAIEIVETQHDRLTGSVTTNRTTVSGNDSDLSAVHIKPGSSVRVQSTSDDQEAGAVLLTGEFRRPGSYTIQKGETLSQLIARAGGVTEQAYPYGAVFTRRSVKEAQQAGFRRAARELNAALATAALKNNADAEAITAAQQLSLSLSATEAPGRVVVEADPRVLALRTDLDVVLEPGDTLFMPKRPGHVLAIGDVLNPGALQFIQGKTVSSYLDEAGGLQVSADDDRVFLVYPNGVAEPVRISAWRNSSLKVPPGSTIVVPKDTDPLAALDLTREITTIASQLALSAASFAVIFDGR